MSLEPHCKVVRCKPGYRFDKAHPIKTLSAPKGVTNMAGANAYAAKFDTSPNTTASVSLVQWRDGVSSLSVIPDHHIGLIKYVKPSPSKPCRSLASLSPCAVKH